MLLFHIHFEAHSRLNGPSHPPKGNEAKWKMKQPSDIWRDLNRNFLSLSICVYLCVCVCIYVSICMRAGDIHVMGHIRYLLTWHNYKYLITVKWNQSVSHENIHDDDIKCLKLVGIVTCI